MKASDVMTTAATTTRPDASLKDAALELARNSISGMPVLDENGSVVGVISEADIIVKESDPHGTSSGFLRWLIDPDDLWLVARFEASTVEEARSAPLLASLPTGRWRRRRPGWSRRASTVFPSSEQAGPSPAS